MAKKLGLTAFDPRDQKVLMRVDFNVPLDGNGDITDDTRIRAALPSIKHIIDGGGALVLMSHLGRPKGKVDPSASLRPVADRLADLVDGPVKFASDTVGSDARAKADTLQPGEILLLENLRFNPGETANDPDFAAALARCGDTYVNDAFGTAHRAHASTTGVTEYFATCRAGFLVEKELNFLGELTADPARPFVAVLGGAKVDSKVDVILNLLGKVDTLLLGGGMIFTFFKAAGLNIGTSLLDADSLDTAREIAAAAKGSSTRLILPEDTVVAAEFNDKSAKKNCLVTDIPTGWMGLDIGPQTVARYREILAAARSVFWNGPMGVFELPSFAAGTRAVGEAISEATAAGAISVVGGGDSVAAINQMGMADRISHISTGGGASLEFMAGRELPGIAVLSDE
jgi:phosphoglycerate kinase